MKRHIGHWLNLVALLLMLGTPPLSVRARGQSEHHEVRCLEESISGFSAEASEARKFLSIGDSRPSKLQLYMTVQSGNIYVHSNFKFDSSVIQASGTNKIYESKFASDRTNMDLSFMVSALTDGTTGIADYNSIDCYATSDFFTDEHYGDFDFSRAKNVYAIWDGESRLTRLVNKLGGSEERLVQPDGDYPFIFTKVRQLDSISVFNTCKSKPLDSSNFNVMVLSENTDTLQSADQHLSKYLISPPMQTTDLRHDALGILEQRFAPLKGHTLLVVGHIENGDFVPTSDLHIPIKQIEDLASKYGITLLILGCDSGKYTRSSGVVNIKIHSSFILPRIRDALTSNTFGQFWHSISSQKVILVVDNDLLKNSNNLGMLWEATPSIRVMPVGDPDVSTAGQPVNTDQGNQIAFALWRLNQGQYEEVGYLNVVFPDPSKLYTPPVKPTPPTQPKPGFQQVPMTDTGIHDSPNLTPWLLGGGIGVIGSLFYISRRRRRK